MHWPAHTSVTARAPRRRGRRALAAAVVVAAAATACGAEAESRRGVTIPLVPVVGSPSGSWAWSADCPVGPAEPDGCAPAGPHVGTAQLAGNAWNLGAAGEAGSGAVAMHVDTGGRVGIVGDLPSAPPCTAAACVAPEANTWVRGFPSVLYGIDQCNAGTSPPQSPHLVLPARVDTIPGSLVGTTRYAADASDITYTIAYDLWLNPTDTTAPCRTDGTLEVMVWTDHDTESLLPDSMRAADATVPYAVDGKAHSGEGEWKVYVSNVFPGGTTAPWGGTIWFVLDGDHRVGSGTVSVDLSVVLAAVGGLLREGYGWQDFAGRYWLDTVAFGIEYGPHDGDLYGTGPVDFSMELAAFCLDVGATVSSAGC